MSLLLLFQLGGGVAEVISTGAGHGQGHSGAGRRISSREPKIRWGKKPDVEKVASVVEDALEQVSVAEAPRGEIDVGMLARQILRSNTAQQLREIETYQQMIQVIKRELDEIDDEDAILLLF